MLVPLNNKETMQQRSISLDREDLENGMESLEEPLKSKAKRRESRQGIQIRNKKQFQFYIKDRTIMLHSSYKSRIANGEKVTHSHRITNYFDLTERR